MTEVEVVYPPNKPLERVLLPSKDPVCYDHLYFVDANDKDEVLVGCSNVVGAYWESTLFVYGNGDGAVMHKYSNYYISGTSISDAVFIPNTRKIVLAEDTSHLRLLSMTEEPSLKCLDFFNANAPIEQLAAWDHEKVVSCGGNNVSIWNIENESVANPFEDYKNVHTNTVKSITVKPSDDYLFATASLDRKACIWDTRMMIPATVLYQNEFSGLTSIAWNPQQTDFVTVGSQGGDLYSFDIRQPREFRSYHHCFDASIHRIKFNNSGYLAVCGDTSKVLVLEPEHSYRIVLKKADHDGVARGLGWYQNTLYTCGFDKKINRYNI
ncbi:hypothetical protein RN001_014654 [Aquatica leii]|uniref:Uncharacterized protein n=1 Tax=Aquatica leii TaxID=1421715 RepID=A0AAN7SN82_9COLE|nr:hypothetical protein RN001_014654 [Aquatica leii]